MNKEVEERLFKLMALIRAGGIPLCVIVIAICFAFVGSCSYVAACSAEEY